MGLCLDRVGKFIAERRPRLVILENVTWTHCRKTRAGWRLAVGEILKFCHTKCTFLTHESWFTWLESPLKDEHDNFWVWWLWIIATKQPKKDEATKTLGITTLSGKKCHRSHEKWHVYSAGGRGLGNVLSSPPDLLRSGGCWRPTLRRTTRPSISYCVGRIRKHGWR